MEFLCRVHAEWLLVRPRLVRTQFGAALLLLGVALVWLSRRGVDPLIIALQAGALGAVIGALSSAGRAHDRAAMATALTHPTTPLAIAAGRWLGIVLPAALLTVVCTAAAGAGIGPAMAGATAAAAVGGCALLVVLGAGPTAGVLLFLFMALAGALEPERLINVAAPGIVRLAAASALELGPALWHYRDAGHADAGAILHALAWAGLGVLLSSGLIARRRLA